MNSSTSPAARKPPGRFRSLYWKISLVLLALLLTLGVLQAWRFMTFLERAADETHQTLNWNLAAKLGDRFREALAEDFDHYELQEILHEMKLTYEDLDFYILDKEGAIKSYFGEHGELQLERVDLKPIERFLQPDRLLHLPIYGDDPRSSEAQEIFSVAPIKVAGENGYLYAVLNTQLRGGLSQTIRGNYAALSLTIDLMLITFVTAGVGLALFSIITKRFRVMHSAVHRFRGGALDERIPVEANDEVAELSLAFNEMADTIQSYIEKLKHTDDQRRQLVANISHDLRSPLTSITGYLETIIMKDATLAPDRRRHYLETVLESSHALKRLIDDLFELSKLEAKDIQPEMSRFALDAFVESVCARFAPAAAQAGIELNAEPGAASVLLTADRNLLDRVLSNLLSNALRHTPRDGKVLVRTRAADDSASFSVIDTGCGIPEEDLPHIFDRFYRVEKDRSTQTGGSGLGLAIVLRIVEAHGGAVSVTSTLGAGSEFHVTLPTDVPQSVSAATYGSAGRD